MIKIEKLENQDVLQQSVEHLEARGFNNIKVDMEGYETPKPTLLKSKWLYLDTLSRMKSNRFRIITFRGHYKFTDTLLNELNLGNKQPIKITWAPIRLIN